MLICSIPETCNEKYHMRGIIFLWQFGNTVLKQMFFFYHTPFSPCAKFRSSVWEKQEWHLREVEDAPQSSLDRLEAQFIREKKFYAFYTKHLRYLLSSVMQSLVYQRYYIQSCSNLRGNECCIFDRESHCTLNTEVLYFYGIMLFHL